MADESTASVIPLYDPAPPPAPKKAKKGGERAKTPANTPAKTSRPRKRKAEAPEAAPPGSEHFIPLEFLSVDANDVAPPAPEVTSEPASETTADLPHTAPTVAAPAAAPSRPIASYVLAVAALGLASVGIVINGWFARSLGSTEAAGWLFLAVGVATDLVALAAPLCAAHLWGAG